MYGDAQPSSQVPPRPPRPRQSSAMCSRAGFSDQAERSLQIAQKLAALASEFARGPIMRGAPGRAADAGRERAQRTFAREEIAALRRGARVRWVAALVIAVRITVENGSPTCSTSTASSPSPSRSGRRRWRYGLLGSTARGDAGPHPSMADETARSSSSIWTGANGSRAR